MTFAVFIRTCVRAWEIFFSPVRLGWVGLDRDNLGPSTGPTYYTRRSATRHDPAVNVMRRDDRDE